MGKTFKDELCPKFIKQDGGAIRIGLSGSGIGYGLSLKPYDEMENEMDGASVFIQSKSVAIAMRNQIDEVIQSGELIDDVEESEQSETPIDKVKAILDEMEQDRAQAYADYDYPVSGTLKHYIEKLQEAIK